MLIHAALEEGAKERLAVLEAGSGPLGRKATGHGGDCTLRGRCDLAYRGALTTAWEAITDDRQE